MVGGRFLWGVAGGQRPALPRRVGGSRPGAGTRPLLCYRWRWPTCARRGPSRPWRSRWRARRWPTCAGPTTLSSGACRCVRSGGRAQGLGLPYGGGRPVPTSSLPPSARVLQVSRGLGSVGGLLLTLGGPWWAPRTRLAGRFRGDAPLTTCEAAGSLLPVSPRGWWWSRPPGVPAHPTSACSISTRSRPTTR